MKSVLSEFRDEATADQLKEQIAKVRERAKTAVDKRALDLLEVQVERRMAEVQNQPRPHIAAALTALKRAYEREWASGEPRLMADFLAGLGTISQRPLADERLREVEGCSTTCKGARDVRPVAHRRPPGRDAVELFAPGSGDRPFAGGPQRISRGQRRHPAGFGEQCPGDFHQLSERPRNILPVPRIPLPRSLSIPSTGNSSCGSSRICTRCISRPCKTAEKSRSDRERSSYKAFERILTQSARRTTDQNHRYYVVTHLCRMYNAGHDLKIPGVGVDLARFANEIFPGVLKQQTNNYQSLVSQVSGSMHYVVSAIRRRSSSS